MKILIIDDEEEIRRSLSFVLEDEGHETRSASNGIDAISAISEREFDIVITDLMLPGMDGMQILSRIKQEHPEIIVVMITGHESVENAVEAMKAGSDDYIPKPIDADELLMKLSKAVEVRRLRYENLLFHRRLEAELDIARKIQQVLLPRQVPIINGLDITAFSYPAKQVGGDYHDIIELPSGDIGIAIGDVSGKGMPASLLMANVQASIRRYAESDYSPKDIMFRINNALCPICQFIEEHRFITLFYGVLNIDSRSLVYSNAGHNYPMMIKNDGAVCEMSNGGGLPCGIMQDYAYDADTVSLENGDILLFYTDGITEAMNSDGEVFGEERLISAVLKICDMGSDVIASGIYDELTKFTGGADQYDDMTLVIMKLKG